MVLHRNFCRFFWFPARHFSSVKQNPELCKVWLVRKQSRKKFITYIDFYRRLQVTRLRSMDPSMKGISGLTSRQIYWAILIGISICNHFILWAFYVKILLILCTNHTQMLLGIRFFPSMIASAQLLLLNKTLTGIHGYTTCFGNILMAFL